MQDTEQDRQNRRNLNTSRPSRVSAKVCGMCWYDIRPTEYEPTSGDYGDCVQCHEHAIVHRVSWAEIVSAGRIGR